MALDETKYQPARVGRPKVLRQKDCKGCNKPFMPKGSIDKFCSYDCAKNNRTKKGKIIKCALCGKEVYKMRCHLSEKNYCSTKCGAKDRNLNKSTYLKCNYCKKQYQRAISQIIWRGSKFCSINCKRKDQRENHINILSVDKLWSEFIKFRASGKCEYCGRVEGLNSHHIYTRSNRAVRFDPDNGICLCVYHHTFSHQFSAHKTPIEFIEWLRNYKGEEWYKSLRLKAQQKWLGDLKPYHKNLMELLGKN